MKHITRYSLTAQWHEAFSPTGACIGYLYVHCMLEYKSICRSIDHNSSSLHVLQNTKYMACKPKTTGLANAIETNTHNDTDRSWPWYSYSTVHGRLLLSLTFLKLYFIPLGRQVIYNTRTDSCYIRYNIKKEAMRPCAMWKDKKKK